MLHHKENFDTKCEHPLALMTVRGYQRQKVYYRWRRRAVSCLENRTSKSHPLEVHPAFPKQP